jgi:hypothetical protein
MRPTSTPGPRHKALRTTAGLLLAITTLTGCTATAAPTDTATPTTPAATSTTTTPPTFASNDEALAAAKAAYTHYLTAGDSAGAIGTDSWNNYLSLTTGSEHAGVLEAREKMRTNGWSFTGATTFDSMVIQSSGTLPDGAWEIRAYLCLDLSTSDMVDNFGVSQINPGRQLRSPMVVVFVSSQENPDQLLISESPIWSGSNFCSS